MTQMRNDEVSNEETKIGRLRRKKFLGVPGSP